MRAAFYLVLICLGILASGCALLDDDPKKKEGICIHSLVITPKPSGCAGASGSSTVYTFCSDERKSEDCQNLSAACTAGNLNESDDTIIFYDGGKRCDTSGYTETCSNPKYKASAAVYCPP